MSLAVTPEPVPLRADGDAMRIGDSRVSLETVVYAFRQGATAEGIVEAYSTLKLSDVYAVIAYYLKHQSDVDAYIAEAEHQSDETRSQIEAADPNFYRGFRERLLARRSARTEPE
jgi:uncharacterized protein (DUF433 family)